MPTNETLDRLGAANLFIILPSVNVIRNSVNGIRNTEVALGRCNIERQNTLDCHPGTVTKTKIERKKGGNEAKIRKLLERLEHEMYKLFYNP